MKQRRVLEIDITKGILTIGMVFIHAARLLGSPSIHIPIFFSKLTDLVTFSGLLFCFGFASWIAYFQSPQRPWFRILKTAIKCYIAFIISGFAYRVLVSSNKPELNLAANIATIRDIPPLSEFLLAFAVITVLSAVFQKVIVISTKRWQNLLASVIICLIFTFLPSELKYPPLVSQLIGGKGFSIFPTIQYLPLFLLGVFAARYPEQFNTRLYILASLGGILIYIFPDYLKIPLTRFPPSVGWILCSTGLFFLYYGLAHIIHAKFPYIIKQYLIAIGQNVLTYLLLSNLVVFSCHALGLSHQLNTVQILIFFSILMGFLFFIQFILIDLNRTNQSLIDQVG